MGKKQEQDEKFLRWLSPSYWLVEGQLSSVRKQRGKDTLQWARNMREFQTWRECPIDPKERILWIRGTLGVGKTIMAGYFIELLKCMYPDAVVLYFFCRRDQAGLTQVRDIIKTLAYQSSLHSKSARSVLDSLRCKNLPIDNNVGIGFLFDKLLRDPLDLSDELFIVLDGLDEGDRVALDTTERPPKPELDIFLQHLTTLRGRLLFVSRGEANISRTIPALITKSLGKGDNSNDIDAYIRQAIDASERLKTHFQNEKLDAFKYFHDKANGIFLWVIIVLHQLAQAKSTSMFRKFLDGFSEASDMEQLYSSVLSRIEGEDRRWMQEILKWVVVCQPGLPGSISVDELKGAVEWSLKDSLPEFETFLEVEGGSLFHLVPHRPGVSKVELIHETLKSFLKNLVDCPRPFYVDHEIANLQVVEVCLDILSTKSSPTSLSQYAARMWEWLILILAQPHRPDLVTERLDVHLPVLRSIYRFFDSGGCIRWMRERNPIRPELPESMKMPHLYRSLWSDFQEWTTQDLHFYLRRLQGLASESEMACRWLQDVLQYPSHLADYMGRAAAERWVCDDLPLHETGRVFSFAFRQYCAKEYAELDEFKDLRTKAFHPFLAWCGGSHMSLKSKKMGAALLVLRNWKEAIEFLVDETESNDIFRTFCLSEAYMGLGDYNGAIRTLENHFAMAYSTSLNAMLTSATISPPTLPELAGPYPIVPGPTIHYLKALALAYKAKGNLPRAAEILEKLLLNVSPFAQNLHQPVFFELFDCYVSTTDYFRALEICLQAPKNLRSQWWFWHCLVEANTQIDRTMKFRQWMTPRMQQGIAGSIIPGSHALGRSSAFMILTEVSRFLSKPNNQQFRTACLENSFKDLAERRRLVCSTEYTHSKFGIVSRSYLESTHFPLSRRILTKRKIHCGRRLSYTSIRGHYRRESGNLSK